MLVVYDPDYEQLINPAKSTLVVLLNSDHHLTSSETGLSKALPEPPDPQQLLINLLRNIGVEIWSYLFGTSMRLFSLMRPLLPGSIPRDHHRVSWKCVGSLSFEAYLDISAADSRSRNAVAASTST